MNKKRILMITTTPFYQEKGSSLRVYSMAKILGSEYLVDMVTYSLGEDVDIPNVIVYRTPAFFKPMIGVSRAGLSKLILDFFVLLKCISLVVRHSYNIVHSEDFEAAFIGRCLFVFNRKKVFVYDLHNRILDNLTFWGDLGPVLKKIVLRCESFVVKRCNLVILNWNKYSNDDIFKHAKTILYYDRIDTDTFELFPLKSKEEYLVYAGNFESYQGIREFVDVFGRCDVSYKLVLIGNPSQEIIDFIEKNNLSDRIILTGRLSVPQTNYLIKNSIAGILPRIAGAQPSMKMIHYLLMGKSVLASDLECNRELITNGYNGLLYKSDAQLKEILQNIKKSLNSLEVGIMSTRKEILSFYEDSYLLKAYEEISR